MSMLQNKTVTNGLIFNIDTGNIKSYVGPAIQNVANYYSTSNGSGTGYAYVAGTQNSYIPDLQTTLYTYTCGVQNNYPTSGACCPNLFAYAAATTSGVSASTLYTYAILYKTNTGYTHPNFMYRYEYTSAGSYITEAGVFDTSKRVYLGDGWYWAWNTFTTQSTTARLYLYSFYYQYSTSSDKMYVAKVGVFPGNFTGMAPFLWPEVNTTRSVTQSLFDLTGNATLDLSNAAYDSSGGITFNNSGYIIGPENSIFNNQTFTMECWCNPTTTSQNGFLFEKGQVNTQYSNFFNGDGTFYFRTMSLSNQDLTFTSSTYVTVNKWNHIVCAYNGSTKYIYVNGILVTSTSCTGTSPTNANGISIGAYGGYNGSRGYTFSGQIAISRVYNRGLNASEVLQNYNATKSRFGF